MNKPGMKNDVTAAPLSPGKVPGDDTESSQLSGIILQFMNTQLGLHPDSIFIDEHGGLITVTIRSVLSDSERNAAKDRRSAELITRSHTEAFRSVCSILVSKCSALLGKTVETATFFLDPESNCASIILTTGKK